MFTVDREGRISGNPTGHIGRLETLLAALECLSVDQLPTEAEVAAAPSLYPGAVAARPIFCLADGNSGRPHVRDPLVHTAPLIGGRHKSGTIVVISATLPRWTYDRPDLNGNGNPISSAGLPRIRKTP